MFAPLLCAKRQRCSCLFAILKFLLQSVIFVYSIIVNCFVFMLILKIIAISLFFVIKKLYWN